ncbi:MAG TPA: choice-of-anchor tandem repeat GloVer-containing protein [Rhizomicrobium sp.]|jgi:uncharacterized repeat protein (TIGR03803 family)
MTTDPGPSAGFQAVALGAAVALAAFASGAQASDYNVIHDFDGTDGNQPIAGLILDGAGNLYGTAETGGVNNDGVIFKMSPNGTETVLYSFTGSADGAYPDGSVSLDEKKGDLYGTASAGGASGNGIIYKLSKRGKLTALHNFDGAGDGGYPTGPLVRDKLGDLYGVTFVGGADSYGTVYELAANGSFAVLHTFTGGGDGETPRSGLIRDGAGNLYGVAEGGGGGNCNFGCGVIYKIAPDGTFTTLYSFADSADGFYPIGGLYRDDAGDLYGTTLFGGAAGYGTAYSLAANGTHTVLYSFTGGDDGAYPEGTLIRNRSGRIYGTASLGGAYQDGTIFKIAPTNKENVVHTFDGSDGTTPAVGLTKGKLGVFYGVTCCGGTNGNGVVFSVTK